MTFCPLENCKMKMSRTDVDRIYLGGNWALPAWSQDFLWERTNFSCLGEVVFLGGGILIKGLGPFILCRVVYQGKKKKQVGVEFVETEKRKVRKAWGRPSRRVSRGTEDKTRGAHPVPERACTSHEDEVERSK